MRNLHNPVNDDARRRGRLRILCCVAAVTSVLAGAGPLADDSTSNTALPKSNDITPGITYTNLRVSKGPWSIHIVRVPRHHSSVQWHTAHAYGKALGLATVKEQISQFDSAHGSPAAAINGDYYQRSGPYAGKPRGLQIMQGEIISEPSGAVSFWIDASDQPHVAMAESEFTVTWPDGATTPIGLNGIRRADQVELYTPALGPSTRTVKGRELILEQLGRGPWLPLRPGRNIASRIREVREGGNSRIRADTMVLSIGPAALRTIPGVSAGDEIYISTATQPSLRGVTTAISGGPVLVREGKRQRIIADDTDRYEVSSMMERHPRSAIGWNHEFYFLVNVDGRNMGHSVGMTLNEFAACLAGLGCQEAMNLDGGGSATLVFQGEVVNHPCDGEERSIANSLVVVQKKRDVKNGGN